MDNDRSGREDPLRQKSFAFAVRIVNLNKHLHAKFKEYVLSKQLLRSGTAIGALVREAARAESKPDFAHKINIALKEAEETCYWLELLHATDYLKEQEFDSLLENLAELLKLLSATLRTTRARIVKH